MPTQKQVDTMMAIMQHTALRGYPPSVRDLARGLGVSSNAARERVKRLCRKGLVTAASGGQGRTVRVTPDGMDSIALPEVS